MTPPDRGPGSTFAVLPGHPASPVVLHVPHAGTHIPAWVREWIVLSDTELQQEMRHMTDAGTDLLAHAVAQAAGTRPWVVLNRLSRLVVDPERFPDDREPMRAVGMGAMYNRTSHGTVLREDDEQHERALVAAYFEPYAQAVADLVDERLAATGRAVLIDLHSYPHDALPYELHPDQRRPAVCLGTDEHHTPDWLVEQAERALRPIGECVRDEPFAGTYVPLRHYRRDRRVAGLMLEVRRDVILADGQLLEPLVGAVGHVVDAGNSPTPSAGLG